MNKSAFLLLLVIGLLVLTEIEATTDPRWAPHHSRRRAPTVNNRRRWNWNQAPKADELADMQEAVDRFLE
uniref:Uncharacterized protein n=1 Tax=Ciona intestinalis TaxID=7719 RepID=F6WUX3_CIOIN